MMREIFNLYSAHMNIGSNDFRIKHNPLKIPLCFLMNSNPNSQSIKYRIDQKKKVQGPCTLVQNMFVPCRRYTSANAEGWIAAHRLTGGSDGIKLRLLGNHHIRSCREV